VVVVFGLAAPVVAVLTGGAVVAVGVVTVVVFGGGAVTVGAVTVVVGVVIVV
jgi:hypothetical protein